MKFDCKLVSKSCSHSSLSMRSIDVGKGIVDSGYREIIYVVLHNLLCEEVTFNVGDKIAQILFEKISLLALSEATKIKFEFEDQTKRETVAFGSSDGKY